MAHIADIEQYTNQTLALVIDGKEACLGTVYLTPAQCIVLALKLVFHGIAIKVKYSPVNTQAVGA